METRSWRNVYSCSFHELGSLLFLCVPTFQLDNTLPSEDRGGAIFRIASCPHVAHTTLVSSAGMSSLRQSILKKNISEASTSIIMQSWSANTHKQYQLYVAQWLEFCRGRDTNPYHPPIGTVLDFIVTLHDEGLKYSTLNTAKSAILAVILPTNNHTIGTHPLVSRFMRGSLTHRHLHTTPPGRSRRCLRTYHLRTLWRS